MFTFIFMCMWISLGDSMADPIKPLFADKSVTEGDTVTLSCSYKDFTQMVGNLHWYRQYPKSKPEFLLYIYPGGSLSENIPPGLFADVHKDIKQVDLSISSAAVSDSVIYYCALQSTVTGNPAALYKNFNTVMLFQLDYLFSSLSFLHFTMGTEAADSIEPDQPSSSSTEGSSITLSCTYTGLPYNLQWYYHKPGSKPEFMGLIRRSTKDVTYAEPTDPRLSINLNTEDMKVELKISSAAVTDSALCYCAMEPTVTATPVMLHKNSLM
ncbi:uncharacterized protein LOC134311833 [Trichomycterus rosablanca]|uniref:uncharacterized protein LOC134307245 n=1 Tax=Trichomycterus rosablanca TaxID=2290929 RepID=UPI002F35CB9F